MTQTFFLPGAGASAHFWRPVADRTRLDGVFFAWPGLGDEPAHQAVSGLDDLVAMVTDRMGAPVDLVAQSMGGLVAIKAALKAPDRIRRLVLVATSGGVPAADLGGTDWRADYAAAFPRAARWILEAGEDLSEPIRSIRAPTLLIWGDRDPISPVSVGERLRALLPNATLHVVRGGDHDLARDRAAEVAGLIEGHLTDAP
ncbi:alpha/beta fold hydrolase [Methylobacterium sp. Leaf118]|uniref:alpha/beta fold hydrolase n=1 Tax=Methylobacterium sp. Leaf118 TaxID=2876562 RepID=UPI001E572864|nr:alpha/beta fold hydrolase [Methylobacterium sp. Leaf118]